jgi:hypothetical protein
MEHDAIKLIHFTKPYSTEYVFAHDVRHREMFTSHPWGNGGMEHDAIKLIHFTKPYSTEYVFAHDVPDSYLNLYQL